MRTNLTYRDNYVAAHGHNSVLNFPDNGTHTWSYWSRELQAVKPDLRVDDQLGARSHGPPRDALLAMPERALNDDRRLLSIEQFLVGIRRLSAPSDDARYTV